MNTNEDLITIPNRFESILSAPQFKEKVNSLILPVNDDLDSFDKISRKASVQQGGILVFLLGATGIGKTTAVYSASVHMAEYFSEVFSVPPEIEYRDVMSWLYKNLPIQVNKIRLVLFDGREITDDDVGLQQFLSGLNQLLRKRKDILFIWPTTNRTWHDKIRNVAEEIGGTNLVPKDSDVLIKGPDSEDWIKGLERLLIQMDLTYNDLAIDTSVLEEIKKQSKTIGEFLGKVRDIIAERITDIRKTRELPTLIFIITSGSEVAGEANRIRRAGTFILKGEELFSYSTYSRAGKWWHERSKIPEQHLAHIISLFDARLTTMTPSAVSYACLHFGEDDLKDCVEKCGLNAHKTNAETTLKATDLYRFFIGQIPRELTSSKKGKTREASFNAYLQIQALSPKRHKSINKAIWAPRYFLWVAG